MNRIEKFKQLLKERIADYEAKYNESGDRMMFGAMNEAKDTLEYIEKVFPEGGNFELVGPEYEVRGIAKEVNPGDFARTAKFGVMIERGDMLYREDIELKEYEERIIEGFHHAIVKHKDKLIDIVRYEKDGHEYVRGTMHIVKVNELL